MFIATMLCAFVAGISMARAGDPVIADVFVCVAIALAAEVYKPEKSTARLAAWMKANVKWACLMALFLRMP